MTIGARRARAPKPVRRPGDGGLGSRPAAGLAGGLAPAPAAGRRSAPPTTTPSSPSRRRRRGDSILVSFSTAARRHAGVEQAIASGLPTTFTYDVELRRPSTFWFDKLVASARIAVTVRFDTADPALPRHAAAGRPRRRGAHHRSRRGRCGAGSRSSSGCRCSPPASCRSTPPTTSASAAGPRRATPGRSGRGRGRRRTAAPASPSRHDARDACGGSPLAGRCGTTPS